MIHETSPSIAIVGGGTTGLFAAALLSRYYPDRKIVVIEKNANVGGLLRSFDYGVNGRFDYGAHNFQETLIPEIDDLFLNLIPRDQWNILADEKREIAGNYFKGAVRYNTPFMDLRHLSAKDYQACLQDFFLNINGGNGNSQDYPEDAYGFSIAKFGKSVTDLVIAPAVKKLFAQDIRNIHRLPLLFLPLSRVCFLDEEIVCDLTRSEILRDRIAYTDQRKLPLERSSGKRIFYPETIGMQQLIDGLEALLLERQNVEILKETAVIKIEVRQNAVESLTLQNSSGMRILPVQDVLWTAGIHPLAKILDLFYPEDAFDRPLKTVFLHYRLDQRLDLQDLYFLYPFDANFLTYRVVNYANYCPQAAEGPYYPVTLEMFLTEDQSFTHDQLSQRGFEELKAMKLIPDTAKIMFSEVEITAEGFPMPTLKNMTLTRQRRQRIENLALKNLTLLGVLAKDDLLFHKDIILDTYHCLKEKLETSHATLKVI